MIDIVLKNSVPFRMRSPSDIFLDNGLGFLKAYLEANGIHVRVMDWANLSHFEEVASADIASKVSQLMAAGDFRSNEFLQLQNAQNTYLQERISEKHVQVAEYLRDQKIRVFGEKTFYGDAWVNTKDLCEKIKKISPETLIVLGGPHVSIWKEYIFDENIADFFVFGAGEETLLKIAQLAKHCTNKHELVEAVIQESKSTGYSNLMYCDEDQKVVSARPGSVNVNTSLLPSYELPEPGSDTETDDKALIHVITDSLGCPWNKCKQCAHTNMYARYHERKADQFVDEMKQMTEKGIGFYRFAGSGATLEHQVSLAKKIIESGLQVKYSAFMRATENARDNYQNIKDSFKFLLESGLFCVGMGGESGSDQINDLFYKGITTDDVKYTHDALIEANIEVGYGSDFDFVLYMMFPTSTRGEVSHEEVLKMNVEFIRDLAPTSVVISPLAAFNGAKVFSKKEFFGIRTGSDYTSVMPEFEYTAYLPKEHWKKIEYFIEDLDFDSILELNGRLTKEVIDLGVLTDITDEQVVLARGAGYLGQDGLREFYADTCPSLVSADYSSLRKIYGSFNRASREMAAENLRFLAGYGNSNEEGRRIL